MANTARADAVGGAACVATSSAWVPASAAPTVGSSACGVERSYHPSAWEAQWAAKLPGLVTEPHWRAACPEVLKDAARIDRWLATVRARRDSAQRGNWSRDVFSHHAYRDTCTGRALAEVPIEPLYALLRHPRFYCLENRNVRGAYRDSKDYMLTMWHAEAAPALAPPARAYLFDLGASLYTSGLGGASQKWFVQAYEARGIVFDRIFAWEPYPFDDRTIYRAAPDHVVDRLSYYNVGVDARPGSKHNPLRTLRAIATPADLVVFKVDIDTAEVEEPLLSQILADPEVSGRIDELFFEHHVHLHPLSLVTRGWGPSVRNRTRCTIHDSYALFRALRERGIRAHSWV